MTEVDVRPDTVWALDFFEAPPCEARAHGSDSPDARYHDGPAAFLLVFSQCYRCGWINRDVMVCRSWVYAVLDLGFKCFSCHELNSHHNKDFVFRVAPLSS